jgi:transcriptional regulator with PAS, ATPase and Fis domain
VLCHGRLIEAKHLPKELLQAPMESDAAGSQSAERPLDLAEAGTIEAALRKYDGNRKKVAAHLGIDKTTLWRKMKKYKINYPPVHGGPSN